MKDHSFSQSRRAPNKLTVSLVYNSRIIKLYKQIKNKKTKIQVIT